MSGTGAYPAFLTDNDRDRLVHHLNLGYHLLFGLNQGAARIGKGFGISFNFFDH